MERKLTEEEVIREALESFVKIQKNKQRIERAREYYEEGSMLYSDNNKRAANEKFLLAIKMGLPAAIKAIYYTKKGLIKYPLLMAKVLHLICLFTQPPENRSDFVNSLRHYYYERDISHLHPNYVQLFNNYNKPAYLKENLPFIYFYITSMTEKQAQPNPYFAYEHSDNIHIREAVQQFIECARQYPDDFDHMLHQDVLERVKPILQFVLPADLFKQVIANYEKNHPRDEEVVDAVSTFCEAKSNLPIEVNSLLVAALKDKYSDVEKIEEQIEKRIKKREAIIYSKKITKLQSVAESELLLVQSAQALRNVLSSQQDDAMKINYMFRWLKVVAKHLELQFATLKSRFMTSSTEQKELGELAASRQSVAKLIEKMVKIEFKKHYNAIQQMTEVCLELSKISPDKLIQEQASQIFNYIKIQQNITFGLRS